MKFPRMFALVGGLQGLVLWALWHADQARQWPATQPVLLVALLFVAFGMPLLLYLSQNVEGLSTRTRRISLAVYLLLLAALGAYSAWVTQTIKHWGDVRGADMLSAGVLGFVSLSLLCGFDFEARRWRYARLFNYGWRNGILLVTAAAMTGVLWGVLYAGAGLMQLIGLLWVKTLIEEPLFVFPMTCFAVAISMALGLERATMIEAIRRFWLSIAAWLLPLVLFFGVLWLLSMPFTGVAKLFNTHSAALMMLWFAALAVQFTNCAYQDGESAWPYPRWLSRATQAAWLSMLGVAGLAWWALGLRIAQRGLSEQRLWAMLVAALAAIYALGYVLSWLKPGRWMAFVARTNIVAAIVLCASLLAFNSPVANIQRIAVAAHLKRVLDANGEFEPDWDYLRWKSGRFGREALRDMAEGDELPAGHAWAKQAHELLAQTSRHAGDYSDKRREASMEAIQNSMAVYPQGRHLPASFVEFVRSSNEGWQLNDCFADAVQCAVWVGDLNGDGQDDIVQFGPNKRVSGILYLRSGKTWRRAGSLTDTNTRGEFDFAQLKNAQIKKSPWADLVIQGRTLRVDLLSDGGEDASD